MRLGHRQQRIGTIHNPVLSHFADMYARACEERADLIADEIITIADTTSDPNKARVRIDARKWWAAKVNPKKYGDKIHTESTSANSCWTAQRWAGYAWV